MPTMKRKWYPGAAYHVTARGNHKDNIFKYRADFVYYLSLMRETLDYYMYDQYKVISYCLMSNHVHLLIKTREKPLGQFMCRLSSRYAKYYNKKYDYIGHLFQSRYFSEIIKSDAQMLETSRYIHLNPVNAKIVEKPEDYEWSSYSMYIGDEKEKLICSDLLLSYFKGDIQNRELYKKFVETYSTPGVQILPVERI